MSPPFHPCIQTRAPQPPSRGRWIHEIKHDGYRLIVRRVGERVSLRTRGGYDWAERYPRIVQSVLKLRVESVALDGEVVWLTENGFSDFEALTAVRRTTGRYIWRLTFLSLRARTFAGSRSLNASAD